MLSRLVFPIALAVGLATPALAQDGTFGPKALLHGNYCGPGNNAPLPPIDALDAACARHDACTPSHGLSSKACNVRLERDAAAVANDVRQPEDLRALAGLVSVGATVLPFDPQPRTRLAAGQLEADPVRASTWSSAPPARPGLYPGETVAVDDGFDTGE